MIDHLEDADIRRILHDCKRIAIVGLSQKESRASNGVARFLLEHGYEIVPIHPVYDQVLGLKCYASLFDPPGVIDMVDIFQRSDRVPPFVDQAIEIGAKVVWMQLDIVHHVAADTARTAGLEVVMDRCPKIEHQRLMA